MAGRNPFTYVPVGPWPQGMAKPQRVTDVPLEALADAVNVDVRPEGSVATRIDWTLVDELPGCHSLYRHTTGEYGVIDGHVCRLSDQGFDALHPVSGPVSWADVGGEAYFATQDTVWRIDGDAVWPVAEHGDDHDIDDPIVPMPGGRLLQYWNGRLIVARGATLLFSEPLRYGAHNPVTGYIRLGGWVEWLAPLESGIYVGLSQHVLWLGGTQPFDMQAKVVSGVSAPGMALVVPGSTMGAESDGSRAVFFTPRGFAVGDQAGNVAYPQADRFSDLPLYRGKLVRDETRVYALREL